MLEKLEGRLVAGALVVMGALLIAVGVLTGTSRPARALTNCTVSDYSLDSEEQTFVALLNAYRQQNGLGAVTVSTTLNRVAEWMVEDMTANNYVSHTDSLGRSGWDRSVDCGYPQGAGENLAAGSAWSTAQAAFDAWKASPGHDANLRGPYYVSVGIARKYSATATFGWYWAAEFGAVSEGTAPPAPATSTPTATPTRTPTKATTQAAPTAAPTNSPTSASTATRTATPTSTGSNATAVPSATTVAPRAGGSQTTPAATRTAPATAPATSVPPTSASAPRATPANAPPSLALSAGANLVAWPSADMPSAQALNGMASTIAIVYQYDASSGQWLRYAPSLPSFLNNLLILRRGAPYWVIARAAGQVPITN
jgi:uncharacterized protein YkwD